MKLNYYYAERENVRKEINKIMKRKDYYKNNKLYNKVKVLTVLETYLTFVIEDLEDELFKTKHEYNSYVD